MSRLRILPLWLALAAALSVILWLARSGRQQAGRLEELAAENRRLAARAAEAVRPVEAGAPAEAPSVPEPARVPPSRPAAAAGPYTENQVIVSLRESLARAQATLGELQSRIERLQSEMEQGAQERQRLAASEAELRERLEATSRILEAVQTEMKAKTGRMTQAEAVSERLHRENRALAERLDRISPLIRELEEVNRRRESCASNLLRRYRDLTDQYRALAGRLESPRESGIPSQAELSRIHNAVAGAEEELGQLTALNAEAARLRQKIGAK
jgi:DNA repair exonuclease SbcCD ATPase subunit